MSDEKEAIHCKTEKEWDFVKSKCKRGCAIAKEPWSKGKLKEYPEGIAISIEDNSYCGLNWWPKYGYKILSFEEWCSKYNYQPDSTYKFEKGKWYLYKYNPNYYLKCSKSDNRELYYSEYICPSEGRHCISSGNFSNEHVTNEVIPLQEIQKYLLKGHPDFIVETQFKKGDYIVQLIDGGCTGGQFKINHCYKQKEPMNVLRPVLDSKMIKDNGWDMINFNNKSTWRYATPKEIEEYNRRGKPYDTNELNLKDIKLDYKGRPLKEFKVGSWYTNPSHKKCPEGSIMRIKSIEVITGNPISVLGILDYYSNKISFDAIRTKEGKIEKYNGYQANSDYDQEMEEVAFEEKQNLEGRYLKALVNNPEYISNTKKGEYFEILGRNYDNTLIIKKYNNTNWSATLSKTTIWELMPEGFNPDSVKNDFVLPEKWCIELTKENSKTLGAWRALGCIGVFDYKDPHGYMYSEGRGYWDSKCMDGYTEITFEQFKKYVLKEKDKSYPFYFQVPSHNLPKYNEIGHRDVIKALAKGNSTLTPKIYTKPTENKTFKKISLIKTKSI